MTPEQEAELRRRQKSRSLVTALLLGLFVVLMFGISMAKMVINP
jgi:cobalt transporter subunit CbtB